MRTEERWNGEGRGRSRTDKGWMDGLGKRAEKARTRMRMRREAIGYAIRITTLDIRDAGVQAQGTFGMLVFKPTAKGSSCQGGHGSISGAEPGTGIPDKVGGIGLHAGDPVHHVSCTVPG